MRFGVFAYGVGLGYYKRDLDNSITRSPRVNFH